MFDPVKELHHNPALFACYILFVYFRGVNAVRIEREMRALGYTTFHRRNLYPRGKQPGWIAKYGWLPMSVPPAVAGGSTRPIETPSTPATPTDLSQEGRFTPAPSSNENGGGKPTFPTATSNGDSASLPSANRQLPTDFSSWLKRVSPNMTWNWRHQQVIIEQLQKVTENKCKRLMIFLPPRHGKSELVSVRYTAWRMQKDPSMNVILGSYNQRLADRMSRKIRTVICDSFTPDMPRPGAYQNSDPQIDTDKHGSGNRSETIRVNQCSSVDENSPRLSNSAVQAGTNPFPFSRPRPKNAVSEWETAMGGSFRAVGAGSGVTGFGANLIVIDDPVKNRAQAESETFRNRVWDWYKDDLYTRLEPDGSIVLIQTRWHEDDLAGRLLRENLDDWTIINLPALSEPRQQARDERQETVPGSPPYEGGVDAALGGRGGSLSTTDVGSTETSQPLSVPPAVAGGLTQQLETSYIPANSTDLSEEGRFTPALDSPQDSGGKPAFPTETDHIGSETLPSPVSCLSSSFDWRDAPYIALCPERFDEAALDKLKTQLGTYSFSALYQQRPTPAGGQIFKREWFRNIIDFAPPGLKWKRGYDLAVSTRTESDYTASFRCAFDKQGNLYISGGFRRRIEFPEQRRYIIDRILNERDTEHGVELALHGQALIQDLRRDPALRGKSLSGVRVSTDKLTRALTWSPLAEDGKVILVRTSEPPASAGGKAPALRTPRVTSSSLNTNSTPPAYAGGSDLSPWINDLLDELAAFPNGNHDDQIDAISLAVQMLAKREFKSRGFLIT